ncbi:hypothetical protein [Hyalangium gracile]|uniref:hypothetical protein n=1 Tax=Hyalangium gracile TaxID=394092 RepID=UPI001CCD52A0|nr:hypothetical protein [Hyalangium gracile]
MTSLLWQAWRLGLCTALVLVGCAEPTSVVPSHPAIPSSGNLPLPTARSFSLERENQGPYLERTVERFRAVSSRPDVKSVLWSASGGMLETQGMEATWTLPRAGTATLTLTAETDSGEQLTETFQYRVSAEASSQSTEPQAANVAFAPVAVDTSDDETGDVCDLAFDAAGIGHLIYHNETHPSLWYGTWNGSAWTTQMVDGMGFNTGGIVMNTMAMVLDTAGKPHIAYRMSGKGVWYATLSGNTWIRERVDTPSLPPHSNYRVSIALDPSQGNRPTIAYSWRGYLSSAGTTTTRTVMAYRTGANAWTATMLEFPHNYAYEEQNVRGEMVFEPNGTLYIPFGYAAIGTWKANAAPASYVFFSGTLYESDQEALVRTGTGRLLLRAGSTLLDITVGTTTPVASFIVSDIEGVQAPVGDLVFAGGKPQEIHLHGSSLELVAPNANNYWTYTDVGTATTNRRVALAQRPTTGALHYCFQSGSKVMFQ